MRPTVDRGFARLIALKRIVTGTLGLAFGIATVVVARAHGGVTPLLVLALVIFVGGGAWTLRDGVRLLRELRR